MIPRLGVHSQYKYTIHPYIEIITRRYLLTAPFPPSLIQFLRLQVCFSPSTSSLLLLLLLLLRRQSLRNHSPKNLTHNRNRAGAHITPNLNTNVTDRSARKREHPFNIVREPVRWQGEDGGLGVPELEKDLETGCAEPAGNFDGPVEGGFLG